MATKGNYQYLLRLYSLVSDYLAANFSKEENLIEIIIAFCTVAEKLFKIRLHGESPVLVYENLKLKEDDALISVIKGKELNIETVKIRETLNRYRLMFQDEFSEDEIQVLIDIYNIRNYIIHGYKPDDNILSDQENIVKKMGTVWEKISNQAVSIFGDDLIRANKPKKKYSEEELEEVLTEEVKKKIKTARENWPFFGVGDGRVKIQNSVFTVRPSSFSSVLGFYGERCPRCGAEEFSLDESGSDPFIPYSPSRTFSDLYKCRNCNLELTRKEYEIAKKL